jgi:hypothetical protein
MPKFDGQNPCDVPSPGDAGRENRTVPDSSKSAVASPSPQSNADRPATRLGHSPAQADPAQAEPEHEARPSESSESKEDGDSDLPSVSDDEHDAINECLARRLDRFARSPSPPQGTKVPRPGPTSRR